MRERLSLGIEWDSEVRDGKDTLFSGKSVLIRKTGDKNPEILDYGHVHHSNTYQEEIYQSLILSKRARRTVTFPSLLTLARNIAIPIVAQRQFEENLFSEVQHRIPFPLDMIWWDYRKTGEDEDSQNLLVCVAKKDVYEKYKKTLTEARINPHSIIPVSEAILALIKDKQELADCLVIYPSLKNNLNVIGLEGLNGLLFRILTPKINSGEEAKDGLEKEIQSSLDYSAFTHENNLKGLVFVGKETGKDIEKELENISINLKLEKKPFFYDVRAVFGIKSDDYSAAFGAALLGLGEKGEYIDFLHRNLRISARQERKLVERMERKKEELWKGYEPKQKEYIPLNRKQLLEQANLCSLFSTMMESGVPILTSLDRIADAFPNYKKEIEDVRERVSEGEGLSTPFSRYKVFHPAIGYLISLGEELGTLDATLRTASDLLFEEVGLKNKKNMFNRAKIEEIIFYSYFGSMMKSGIPLLRTIKALGEISDYLPKNVFKELAEKIEIGAPRLSPLVAEHPKYFNPAAVALIRTAESTGALDAVLNRYAQHLKKSI